MLNHDLILCAAEQVIGSRGPVGVVLIQRKVRVGYVTASQVLLALEDIGIVAPPNGATPRRTVLVDAFDREAVLAATDRAVAAGKFELDGEPCPLCRTDQPRTEARAERHAYWLTSLLAERLAQVEAGTWPPESLKEAERPMNGDIPEVPVEVREAAERVLWDLLRRVGAHDHPRWDVTAREAVRAVAPAIFAAGVAAGRTQAAADIHDHSGPDPSPANPAWWAGYREAQQDAARVAAGSDD